MELGKAFGFVFEDEQWIVTLLLGGLIMLIPVVGQIVMIGFMLETARNVARGDFRPLPKWNTFGDKLVQGFYGFILQLVYLLPLLIVTMVFSCMAISTGAIMARTSDEAGGSVILLTMVCLVPLMVILGIAVQPFILAGLVRMLQQNSMSAGLQFRTVIHMVRSDLGTWIILWLLQILCSFLGSAGFTLLWVGVLFTFPYSQAVFGHLLGQVMKQKEESQLPAAPYQPL